METQLERAGLEYEIVAATDGRDLTTGDLERLVDPALARRAPRWLRPGAIGCALSHLDVYQSIIDQGLEHALVLEDDAILKPEVRDLIDWLPPELDGVEAALLYYTAKTPCGFSDRQAVTFPNGSRLLYPMDLRPLNSTMAYVITRSACLRLVDFIVPITVGADSWFGFHDEGVLDRVRFILPRPIGARHDFKSTMDYSGGVAGGQRLTAAISEGHVFPFHLILALRRARLTRKMSRFSVVSEDSPYAGTERPRS